MELTEEHYRLGKIAFDAYRKNGRQSHIGNTLPLYDEVHPAARDAWASAAIAVALDVEMAANAKR